MLMSLELFGMSVARSLSRGFGDARIGLCNLTLCLVVRRLSFLIAHVAAWYRWKGDGFWLHSGVDCHLLKVLVA